MDSERIDEAILALLYLGLHDKVRTWKSFDWDAMTRLHEKGHITAPVGTAKLVVFTEQGLRESERLFQCCLEQRRNSRLMKESRVATGFAALTGK